MSRAIRGMRHRSQAVLALVMALAISSMVVLVSSAAAQDPYEPNDTVLGATGPLTNNQSYTAGLETENDKDFFFFYVTSPSSPVTLALRNLGGGASLSYIGVAILDVSGTHIGTVTNIEEGEEKAMTVTLEPQKYFVEVASNLDYGAGYSLTTQGGAGAFGPWSSIASRCAAARSASQAARTGLTKAEAKLQRASARLHRSRYSTRAARRSAQAVYLRAKARTVSKRKALGTARKSERPWCFIPQ